MAFIIIVILFLVNIFAKLAVPSSFLQTHCMLWVVFILDINFVYNPTMYIVLIISAHEVINQVVLNGDYIWNNDVCWSITFYRYHYQISRIVTKGIFSVKMPNFDFKWI